MIKDAINSLIEGNDLSERDMIGAMNDIMEGQATDAQIASS